MVGGAGAEWVASCCLLACQPRCGHQSSSPTLVIEPVLVSLLNTTTHPAPAHAHTHAHMCGQAQTRTRTLALALALALTPVLTLAGAHTRSHTPTLSHTRTLTRTHIHMDGDQPLHMSQFLFQNAMGAILLSSRDPIQGRGSEAAENLDSSHRAALSLAYVSKRLPGSCCMLHIVPLVENT